MRLKSRVFTIQKVAPAPAVRIVSEIQLKKSVSTVQHKEVSNKQKNVLLTKLNPTKNWIIKSLKCYCKTTSLHGFNYITSDEISRAERIFWIFVVIVAIIVSLVLVSVSYTWNRKTPTVTVIESSHFPTWNVPFPAVTICNFNKISRLKAMTVAKKMKRSGNMTDEELAQLFRTSVYLSFALNYTTTDFWQLEDILSQNNYTSGRLVNELTPNCIDMISKCIWKGTKSRCDSLFQKVNTTEGICCSFNYFGMQSNNFPEKLAYQVPKRSYRATGCGYPTGLTVLLNPESEDYYGAYFSSYGFRLLIHNAYDFPGENAETKVLTAARESFVRIAPQTTYATMDVRQLDVNVRNCLFGDERRLSVMQRYSYINCLSECRTQIMYKLCGCAPTNLPNNGSYTVCNFTQTGCVIENRDIFSRALPNVNETLLKGVDNAVNSPCDCLPDCELNQYPAEITMGKLNMKFSHSNTNEMKNINTKDHILLHVFFSDLMSTRYRMDIYQNWLSALASFGGLLGLIMGFSIVTAFELVYYLTLRPIFNYFNHVNE